MYDCVDTNGRAVPLLATPPSLSASGPMVVCPWLAGLPAPEGLWLSLLPIHDVNAYLSAQTEPGPADLDLYWGIFALDPSRSHEVLLRLAAARGIKGIVNMPSIGMFSGRTRHTLQQLGYSVAAESDFLAKARARGFRTAMAHFEEPASKAEPTFRILIQTLA